MQQNKHENSLEYEASRWFFNVELYLLLCSLSQFYEGGNYVCVQIAFSMRNKKPIIYFESALCACHEVNFVSI